ncbi:hypothetical protein CGRA01v4_14364 [Colletotrichum graminicola]|nr:hypothetical protein CGRA01v4_14364 [Colletotrichum graminicola]
MVRIGGGAPRAKHDIRLGDVVVSTPRGNHGGLLHCYFDRMMDDGAFKVTGFLAPPASELMLALISTRAQLITMGNGIEQSVVTVLTRLPRRRGKWRRPSPKTDILYRSHIVFDPTKPPTDVGPDAVISRPERSNPGVHYGLIASADRVMRAATIRDKLAADRDVLCFETEATGVMGHFPCLVVMGICYYSDSHKNKDWQEYAALNAAACAKAITYQIPERNLGQGKRLEELAAMAKQTKSPLAATRSLSTFSATTIDKQASSDRHYFDKEIIKRLHVVIGAEYNARNSHPDQICHPRARLDLLQEVQAWAENPTSPPVFWLYGMAGHGKSTIARTVAKRFDEKKILGATFFFKRGHIGRCGTSNLFSTIASQLARRRRELLPYIRRAIERTNDISSETIEEQFSKLIVSPLMEYLAHSSKTPAAPGIGRSG